MMKLLFWVRQRFNLKSETIKYQFDTTWNNKQLLNEVEYRIWRIIKAEAVTQTANTTDRGLNNSAYPTRNEFKNCFIIDLFLYPT
jgi:hypothetical protein